MSIYKYTSLIIALTFLCFGCTSYEVSEYDEMDNTLKVGYGPTVNFETSCDTAWVGDNVYFTDVSTGEPTEWMWSFDDGQTSSEQNPVHIYMTPGTYVPVLTADNQYGTSTAYRPINNDHIVVVEPPLERIEDIDGNKYYVKEMGGNTWMLENLKVTHLNDGQEISRIDNSISWSEEEKQPAYSPYIKMGYYQEEGEEITPIIGIVYNGLAVQTGKLCPEGWHVPSVSDWKVLIESSNNQFYPQPVGYRLSDGSFERISEWEVDMSDYEDYYWAYYPGRPDSSLLTNYSGHPKSTLKSDSGPFTQSLSNISETEIEELSDDEYLYYWTKDISSNSRYFQSFQIGANIKTDYGSKQLHFKSGLQVRCIKDK